MARSPRAERLRIWRGGALQYAQQSFGPGHYVLVRDREVGLGWELSGSSARAHDGGGWTIFAMAREARYRVVRLVRMSVFTISELPRAKSLSHAQSGLTNT